MRLLYPACLITSLLQCLSVLGLSGDRRKELKEETRQLFVHGYEGYMKYAYPADELRPLSCGPLYRDRNPANFGINDIHANVSMTLLDVLSTLPLINPSALPDALEKVTESISFDQDVKVQVFEMTIRALGALLSTYQYLDTLPDDEIQQARVLGLTAWFGDKRIDVKKYRERLLQLALDLGERMVPAFNTPTGIPYARVNLRHGVGTGESIETCAAGAGSLILEFTVLSRLTGDDRFEKLAHTAYMAIWNRRSAHNLVGNTIGVTHGQWLAPGLSGVGAGMDSYFEYGMKAGIMLGDDVYLDIFHDAYAAIQTHVRTPDGFFYRPIQYRSLLPATPITIDSLSAFFPSVQVLAGDIESAIKGHLTFWNLWRRYSAIPESWAIEDRSVEWTGWPGRPEFIESTYYLYRATKDPFYLRVGERVLHDIRRRVKTSCGFASLSNVVTGELEDRMESFVLSETLKYLYLLFDDNSQALSNKVFTTEGHPLSLPLNLLHPSSSARRRLHKSENLVCPMYQPPTVSGLVVGIERRADYEYARSLVFGKSDLGVLVEDEKRVRWWEGGICPIPVVPKFSFDISIAPIDLNATQPVEDASPSPSKVFRNDDGNLVVADVDGLKIGVRWRLDGKGYDISNVGPHRVRPGQQVFVTDPKMSSYLPQATLPALSSENGPSELILRFSTSHPGAPNTKSTPGVFLHAMGASATFGRSLGDNLGGWGIGGSVELVAPIEGNEDGCSPYSESGIDFSGKIILARRGNCAFLDKLVNAAKVGAIGVLTSGYPTETEIEPTRQDPFQLFRPSAEEPSMIPMEAQSYVKKTGMVYVDGKVGGILEQILKDGTVWVELLELGGLGLGSSGSGSNGQEEDGMGGSGRSGSGGEGGRRHRRPKGFGYDDQHGDGGGRLVVNDWDIWNLKIGRPP